MNDPEKQAYIFGGILALANRLQVLGDKLDENVTLKQWLLIAMILKSEHPSPTISEVAEMVGYSRQNVKKMALILEKRGFVSLIKDAHDARIFRMHLTPKCAAYFQTREEKEAQFMVALFDGFNEESTDALCKGIMKLADNIITMESLQHENEKE
ncbi:MarR family winged helix-turn-helix transcriptional regulator [Paenibacillus sp. 1001270B_150601_E10]|uniref:MarR family winged helix-turn-helix transcriptional regulator n=1 Tax=Paenibacillus sp. 1001270B_150601_E10 TaxID=2787079 RepID=UPI00189CB45A|nr:MarR family transcriptional regulator [Paenibacillus sp. 1001270B_150601_E10]